ncbi:hypothetical protein V2154_02385 [Ewingella sp. CoE-038-23]|uniref:phage baseplate plug family protein n=1 Tax=Ewingella docleensis TaxID=3118588 RepID=UPI0033658BAC
MNINEIPLSPDNQTFSTTLAGVTLTMRIVWREGVGWVLDLIDNNDVGIVTGIALVSGVDLLAQFSHLQLGFKLVVACDDASQEYPTKTDLGINSHLYVLTE